MSPYCCKDRGLSVLGVEDARVNTTLFSFLGKPVGNEIQGQLHNRNTHTTPGTSANIEGLCLVPKQQQLQLSISSEWQAMF